GGTAAEWGGAAWGEGRGVGRWAAVARAGFSGLTVLRGPPGEEVLGPPAGDRARRLDVAVDDERPRVDEHVELLEQIEVADGDRRGQAGAARERERLGGRAVGHDGDQRQPAPGERVRGRLQAGRLLGAGHTARAPEVHDHDLAGDRFGVEPAARQRLAREQGQRFFHGRQRRGLLAGAGGEQG